MQPLTYDSRLVKRWYSWLTYDSYLSYDPPLSQVGGHADTVVATMKVERRGYPMEETFSGALSKDKPKADFSWSSHTHTYSIYKFAHHRKIVEPTPSFRSYF